MYPISTTFSEYLQARSREWMVKVDIGGKEYGAGSIVDFEIHNSATGGQTFELGAAVVSKLTLRIKTTDTIAVNARVVPYIGLRLPANMAGAESAWQDADVSWDAAGFPWIGAVTEWMPLGEFFIDSREEVLGVWVFTCYDKLMRANVPYVSQLTYPATQKAVWEEICSSLGFAHDSSVVIDPAFMIQAGPAGYTKREVLAYIASANASCLYVAKDGTLRFRRFGASDEPVVTLTKADYIRAKQTNPTKVITKVVVVYNTDDGLSYTAGSGDENHTLYVENPFGTQAMADKLLARLNGFYYMPVEIDARGYPQIEVGDRVWFGAPVDSPSWMAADTAWNAMEQSWEGYEDGGITVVLNQTYSFKGGLRMSFSAPSISEQQSEFQVEGSLSSQIGKLNRTSLREGRSYYGATLTRTEGLVIEREDHKSKVILNSDEQRFVADGQDALWFDLVSRKFKFAGTLEAADGVFSGSLQAATGTFAGNLQAAGGTFSGNLSAAGGTFTGELQAATGTFSGNLTAAGGTFSGNLQAAGGTFSGNLSAAGGTFTGTLVGVNGDFSGTITAATINGGTITGSTIRTAVSGKRLEMDTPGLRSYDDNGVVRIGIESFTGLNYQQLQVYGQDGIRTGILSGTIGQYNIGAMNGANMVLGAARIAIDSPIVDFQGAAINNIALPISAITNLESQLTSLQDQINSLSTALGDKASKNANTGSAGAANGGIPIGTNLMTSGGGVVTWNGIPAHIHIQS